MQKVFQHIYHEFKKHSFDYILFLSMGIFFLLALQVFRGQRLIEFIILLSFASFYIIWGLYHHIVENTAELKRLIEYVIIGFTIMFLVKIIFFP